MGIGLIVATGPIACRSWSVGGPVLACRRLVRRLRPDTTLVLIEPAARAPTATTALVRSTTGTVTGAVSSTSGGGIPCTRLSSTPNGASGAAADATDRLHTSAECHVAE